MKKLFLIAILAHGQGYGQGLDPKSFSLFKLPAGAWPTYNGDYSGRRFSDLDHINQSNVGLLKIEWMYRIQGIGPQRGVGNPTIKSTPLLVNGILYFTIPDHVFAVDAHTGDVLFNGLYRIRKEAPTEPSDQAPPTEPSDQTPPPVPDATSPAAATGAPQ